MDTATKEPAKKVAPAPGSGVTKKREKVPKGQPRNYDLGSGLYRFSRTKMFHKTAKYKFIGKKNEKKVKPKKPRYIIKPIGGDKNGGTRKVLIKKRKNYYPTAKRVNRHPPKKCFRQHKRYIRSTLTPGTICILLAGVHKGKRVVLLKVLRSGLLLVTGPYSVNGCPLRRICQNYVIATRTKIDISAVELPENINDDYFKRKKAKRPKKTDGDIFAPKKEAYKVSDQRKSDQKVVDKAVVRAIKKGPDSGLTLYYLSCMFGLQSSQYPHRMKF